MNQFTQSPQPVKPGQTVTICVLSEQWPVYVNLDWTPDGTGGIGFILEQDAPCYQIVVPAGCTGGLVTDDAGNIPQFGLFVVP